MAKNFGGPAFPNDGETVIEDQGQGMIYEKPITGKTNGMTLRDYFAASVLAGKWEPLNTNKVGEVTNTELSSHCYDIADAMIEEREKRMK